MTILRQDDASSRLRLVSWDDADSTEWERFLSVCPDATFFHAPEWMALLVRSFPDWHGNLLFAEDPTDGWQALLPFVEVRHLGIRTILSMPFGTFGGILALPGCPPATLKQMCFMLEGRLTPWNTRGMMITEFDNNAMTCLRKEAGQRFTIVPQTTQVLDLGAGFENVWRNSFERQRRRQTRCARRRGLVLRRAKSITDFAAFFDLFHEVSRAWNYRIRLPKKFFRNLYESDSRHVHLWMAEFQDQLVAGNIFFSFKDQAISWSGVMRRSHAWLHPSVALQHASIEDACTCGCREYHFGPSLSFQSVERFKEQFGSEKKEYRNWAVLTPLGRVLERLRPAISRACGSEERS